MKKKLLFFDFLFLCLFSSVFACTQPLENPKVMVLDDANVITENVGPSLIEENVNGEKAGDREEQIENGGKIKGNAILYLTADGKLKIEGRDWKHEENTLTILYDDGACEWLAFRIANKSEDMFEKVIVPSITSIILGDSVQIVLPDSFKDLINLESVTLGENLKYIGESAFEGCAALKDTVIPDSVRVMDWDCFLACESLQSINFPNCHLDHLGENVIGGCFSLREITIPVGSGLFYEGERLLKYYELMDFDAYSEEANDKICLQRVIITGEITEKINLSGLFGLPIHEIVFTQNPPEEWEVPFTAEDGVTVYYLKEHAGEWAPNGEMEWKGFPTVGINSLDDLPPVA